jgi:hypothetical protein
MASMFACLLLINGATGQHTGLQPAEGKPVKDFQLGIFPFIGTDGADAINNTYKVSINALAGITGGINGLELESKGT